MRMLAVGLTIVAGIGLSHLRAAEVIAPPKAEVVRQKTLDWAATRGAEPAVVAEIERLFDFGETSPKPELLLERTIEAFVLAAPETRSGLTEGKAPDDPAGSKGFYGTNVRLALARQQVHNELYEEALETLGEASLLEAIDPATFLFAKATCEKWLLLKADGLKTIDQLLTSVEGVPVRYATVATLMKHDLEAIKDRSLDEAAWKMDDVERRLKLARAGERTQKIEDEIVGILDEIIKKIEEQSGGGGGGANNNSNQSSNPANDSTVKGSTAPGTVDKTILKNFNVWGNLNEKDRAKVKNLFNRDLPAHYREAVEEYMRKLAGREKKD